MEEFSPESDNICTPSPSPPQRLYQPDEEHSPPPKKMATTKRSRGANKHTQKTQTSRLRASRTRKKTPPRNRAPKQRSSITYISPPSSPNMNNHPSSPLHTSNDTNSDIIIHKNSKTYSPEYSTTSSPVSKAPAPTLLPNNVHLINQSTSSNSGHPDISDLFLDTESHNDHTVLGDDVAESGLIEEPQGGCGDQRDCGNVLSHDTTSKKETNFINNLSTSANSTVDIDDLFG